MSCHFSLQLIFKDSQIERTPYCVSAYFNSQLLSLRPHYTLAPWSFVARFTLGLFKLQIYLDLPLI